MRNMTPPGAEPHDLELSARDVARVRSADLVLYLGAGFQPALEDAVDGAEGTKVDVLAVDGLGLHRSDGRPDPHVWLDPVRFRRIADRIGAALGRGPAARAFDRRLATLDAEYRAGLAHCSRRELVTAHAAFAYLADRYRLRQVSVSGLSPEAEPTPGELTDAVSRVRQTGAHTVFTEPLASPRLAETVAREAGVRTAVLDPLEGLTEAEVDRGADYFSVMRANLRALRAALGCR